MFIWELDFLTQEAITKMSLVLLCQSCADGGEDRPWEWGTDRDCGFSLCAAPPCSSVSRDFGSRRSRSSQRELGRGGCNQRQAEVTGGSGVVSVWTRIKF